MTPRNSDERKPEQSPRLTVVLDEELDAWLEVEAKRRKQGKATTARMFLAEAFERASLSAAR